MKKVLQFRIEEKSLDEFKQYCTDKDTTMSKVLIDYITILLSNSGEILPGEEKNVGKRTAPSKIFHCPYCGTDITDQTGSDRLLHVKNCKNSQNR